MQYGMFYMYRCVQSGDIDAWKTCHAAYTTVSLKMKQRVSKHLADNGY
jgi:hypothetical protein